MTTCLEEVTEPKHLLEIADILRGHRAHNLVKQTLTSAQTRVREHKEKILGSFREHFLKEELKSEQKDLRKIKKQLAPAQQKQLDELEKVSEVSRNFHIFGGRKLRTPIRNSNFLRNFSLPWSHPHVKLWEISTKFRWKLAGDFSRA
jgi:hypothetical protein